MPPLYKQLSLKLNEEQFDKLDTICRQRGMSKQEFGLRAFKVMFLILKNSYSIVDKNGVKVEIL